MRTLGYNQPLYILPFDHRGSFETKMFGWHGEYEPHTGGQLKSRRSLRLEAGTTRSLMVM